MFGTPKFCLFALVACSVPLTGCLPAAYIVPEVDRFAVKSVNSEGSVVTPFLVTMTYRGYSRGVDASPADDVRIVKLPIRGERISKTKVSAEAFAGFLSVISRGWSQSHYSVLRLYRPGYRLEEVSSGTSMGTIQWKRAGNASEEELALDQLISASSAPVTLDSGHSTDANQRWFVFGLSGDPKGTPEEIQQRKRRLNADKAVLQFVAAEYERIANKYDRRFPGEVEAADAVQPASYEKLAKPGLVNKELSLSRLKSKARVLRELAGESY